MEELFDELDAPVVRLASQDIPTPYNGTLEAATIVQPADIVAAVERLLYG
jgi:pyruvate dehydrogenase E1 component beta subunit